MANNLAHVIAVTGLAGHFPGATAIESIRHDLGGDAPPPEPGQPGPAAGSGLEPGSAGRRFADSARLAIRHAACAGRSETERTGLFVGVYGEARYDAAVDGGDGDRLAAEVAGELGLRGPAATVVDPSSPALAAVDRAAESLRRAECDLALAGEVASGGGEVPAGDAAAAHAGALVLRRLSDALVDGDRVLAVLRGSAVHGAGFEAPPAPAPRLRHEGGEEMGEPGPVRARPALGNEYVPPANRLEAAIAGLWQEHLGLDRVGVQDNFFELGGNSLVGTQIIALLKEWLHQEIPTVSLYEGPTVSALAGVLLHGGGGSPRGYDAVRERGERRRRKLQRLTQEARPSPAE